MRSLEKNKSRFYMTKVDSVTEDVDVNGNYTGERTKVYTTPIVIRMNAITDDGSVSREVFGNDSSFDMVAVSTDIELTEDTLLFLSSPVSNYDTTYDYKVKRIVKSLNSWTYGLERRI